MTLTAASWFNDVDVAGYSVLSSVAGTANAITATGPANYTLSATRPSIWITPASTNTGATAITITPSGGAALTQKNIFFNGGACTGGELIAGVPAAIIYDGTQFSLATPAPRRPTVQVVTSTGTHSVPSWSRRAKVYAKAAGGSGGGSSVTGYGGGGGEGEERWGWFNVVPGTTVTVTINAGGAGINANTNSAGNVGGNTVVTDGTFTVTAVGGSGGTSGNNGGSGGAGGTSGAGGDYAMPGARGEAGADISGLATAINSSGGGKGGGATAAVGVANSGGGGGGGTTGDASGAGATGIGVVEYWP
ncbi:glycine-rich domain-containing protein [Microbacterium sp.]|uniref:glycine-rich domain-containing protein n=1 Tax=Microbacterium sp. TaxID=51671 RepID=UPI00273432D1|nr:hypothetical protein [Microbacterium sp.]MDP3952646.1 hypothetical protein [Microbacterium sp.]